MLNNMIAVQQGTYFGKPVFQLRFASLNKQSSSSAPGTAGTGTQQSDSDKARNSTGTNIDVGSVSADLPYHCFGMGDLLTLCRGHPLRERTYNAQVRTSMHE